MGARCVTNLIWLGETVVVANSTILEEHTDLVIPIQTTYNFVSFRYGRYKKLDLSTATIVTRSGFIRL